MRLVILGAPGAGKGTQAAILVEKCKIPHVSTGDIFRANIKNNTELGKKAKTYIDKGLLVPDELTIALVKERLSKDDCKNGFLLDGFPRTIPQAEALDSVLFEMGTKLDKVLNLYVEDSVIIGRLSGRRVCPACGASFHIISNPTSEPGICDFCGAHVVQREDDNESTIRQRLKVYHEQTEPLIGYYAEKGILVTAYGKDTIEDTTAEVLKVLEI